VLKSDGFRSGTEGRLRRASCDDTARECTDEGDESLERDPAIAAISHQLYDIGREVAGCVAFSGRFDENIIDTVDQEIFLVRERIAGHSEDHVFWKEDCTLGDRPYMTRKHGCEQDRFRVAVAVAVGKGHNGGKKPLMNLLSDAASV